MSVRTVGLNSLDVKSSARKLMAEIKAGLQARLAANNYGLQIEYLGIKKLGLPDSVTQSVFEQMTSERKKVASASENQGNAEASIIRSTADGKAAEMLADAEGQAKRIRSEGETAAAELLPIFQKNPDLAIFLLSLESLEQSLKERSILILDQRTPPFDLFNGLPASKATGNNK